MAVKRAVARPRYPDTEMLTGGDRKDVEKSEHTGALNRGLKILSTVVAAERPMSLSEISAEVELSPATVHRLLQTLLHGRHLFCDDHGRFSPMPKTVSPLGSCHPLNQLRQSARSVLNDLQKKYGPTAALTIIMGTARLIVDFVGDENQFLPYIDTELTTPLYASSSGKLLLSELSLDQRQALLRDGPYRSFTEHTITDPDALAAELAAVKRNGYATNINEHMLGITSIGVPVYSLSGRHLGSIALSGANAFFPPETTEAIITDLKQAAYLFSVASPAMRAVARFLGK